MTFDTMHAYYSSQGFLPTHGRLQSREDLKAHAAAREKFLNDRLYLPRNLFYRAALTEIGPDSGENALAFAQWGAVLTLVEPNPAAHAVLLEYFRRYGLVSHIVGLESCDVAEMARREVLSNQDIIVAEGFVYTVQPTEMWVNLFSRMLKPGGMALISYYEYFGGWVELYTKMVYTRVKALTGWEGAEVADKLFSAKWGTIPHMRTIEQWRMDVLQNPFVRLKYFLEADALCRQFEAAGMRLYSSWPQYRNGLQVHWHKSPEPEGARAAFIQRQHLAWMLGVPAFLHTAIWEDELTRIVRITDSLIDKTTWNNASIITMTNGLWALSHILSREPIYGDVSEAQGRVKSLIALFDLLTHADVDQIIDFCRHDAGWLRTWGQANSFGAWQKNYD